jgi:ADP-ribose pyrophosphatase
VRENGVGSRFSDRKVEPPSERVTLGTGESELLTLRGHVLPPSALNERVNVPTSPPQPIAHTASSLLLPGRARKEVIMTWNVPERPQQDSRIEIAKRSTPFQGHFRIDRYRLRHRTHDGGWTGFMQREVFERGHAVAVLPYDPRRDTIVLIEQFRLPAYLGGLDPWQMEIVAGIIEDGESPEQVAWREVPEETGLQLRRLEPLLRYMPSQGATTENLFLYCGEVDSSGLGGVHGLDHEHEDILPSAHSVDSAFEMLAQGRLQNSPAIIALQWLALNRDQLRNRWLSDA